MIAVLSSSANEEAHRLGSLTQPGGLGIGFTESLRGGDYGLNDNGMFYTDVQI